MNLPHFCKEGNRFWVPKWFWLQNENHASSDIGIYDVLKIEANSPAWYRISRQYNSDGISIWRSKHLCFYLRYLSDWRLMLVRLQHQTTIFFICTTDGRSIFAMKNSGPSEFGNITLTRQNCYCCSVWIIIHIFSITLILKIENKIPEVFFILNLQIKKWLIGTAVLPTWWFSVRFLVLISNDNRDDIVIAATIFAGTWVLLSQIQKGSIFLYPIDSKIHMRRKREKNFRPRGERIK